MSVTLRVCLFAVGCAVLSPVAARADEAEVHYRMCLSHKKAGKLADARARVPGGHRAARRPRRGLLHAGQLQRQTGELEQALKNFRKVRELEATSAIGWAGEGSVLLRLNRIDEAVTALKQAVALDPNDTTSVGNLGNALRKQNKPDEAIAMYQKALEKNPDNVDLLNNLACRAARAAPERRGHRSSFKKALAKKPGDPSLRGQPGQGATRREALRGRHSALRGGDQGGRRQGRRPVVRPGLQLRADRAEGQGARGVPAPPRADSRPRTRKGAEHVEEVIQKLEGK